MGWEPVGDDAPRGFGVRALRVIGGASRAVGEGTSHLVGEDALEAPGGQPVDLGPLPTFLAQTRLQVGHVGGSVEKGEFLLTAF